MGFIRGSLTGYVISVFCCIDLNGIYGFEN